jgi:hypothetical protein
MITIDGVDKLMNIDVNGIDQCEVSDGADGYLITLWYHNRQYACHINRIAHLYSLGEYTTGRWCVFHNKPLDPIRLKSPRTFISHLMDEIDKYTYIGGYNRWI